MFVKHWHDSWFMTRQEKRRRYQSWQSSSSGGRASSVNSVSSSLLRSTRGPEAADILSFPRITPLLLPLSPWAVISLNVLVDKSVNTSSPAAPRAWRELHVWSCAVSEGWGCNDEARNQCLIWQPARVQDKQCPSGSADKARGFPQDPKCVELKWENESRAGTSERIWEKLLSSALQNSVTLSV